MKKIFVLISMIICLLYFPCNVNAEYEADKEWSTIKRGDAIYFDTTGLDWDDVYIHIWQDGGAEYTFWNNDNKMTKVTDNIYVFVAPDDIDEIYNMIIFKNGINGSGTNQTISLGYIERKFAYKITGTSSGKQIGYWYLYDKDDINSHLENIKKYQEDKDYYTDESYGNLDDLITEAINEYNSEIILETKVSGFSGIPDKYYINIDFTFDKIDTIISNLKVNIDILKDIIDEEKNNINDYQDKYTPESLKEFTDELSLVNDKLINDSDGITISYIKQNIQKIDELKDNFVKQADKTELNKILDEISILDKDNYTEKSYEKLVEIVANALVISNDKNATQIDVDEYVEKLKEGIANLKVKDTSNNLVDNTIDISSNEDVNVPKTWDDTVTIFVILLSAIITLLGILIIRKKLNSK